MDDWQLIFGILGALSAVIAIVVALQKRDLVPPKVDFGCVIAAEYKKKFLGYKKVNKDNLIILTVPTDCDDVDVSSVLLWQIKNPGKVTLHNVSLQIEYPRTFSELDVQEAYKDFQGALNVRTYEVGAVSYLRFEIGDLRPGEGHVIGQPLLMKPNQLNSGTKNWIISYRRLLLDIQNKGADVVGICPVKAFLYSQDIERKEELATVIWIKADDILEAQSQLNTMAKKYFREAFPIRNYAFRLPFFPKYKWAIEWPWIVKYPWEELGDLFFCLILSTSYSKSSAKKRYIMDMHQFTDEKIFAGFSNFTGMKKALLQLHDFYGADLSISVSKDGAVSKKEKSQTDK